MSDYKHAGIILDALMKEKGVGQVSLALDTGLTTKTINMICKGKVGHITADVAVRIAHYFPVKTAEYWLEMDLKHRLHNAEAKFTKELESMKAEAKQILEAK